MDGFGFGRLAFLMAALVLALGSACSVSLADTSPEVLRYCPVSASSGRPEAQTAEDQAARRASEQAKGADEADADCIPRFSASCDAAAASDADGPSADTECGS